MVHHNGHVYHGGTEQGCKFLTDNSDVSRRFHLAVHTEGIYTQKCNLMYNYVLSDNCGIIIFFCCCMMYTLYFYVRNSKSTHSYEHFICFV